MDPLQVFGFVALGGMLVISIALLIWHGRFMAKSLERIEGIASATLSKRANNDLRYLQ